jgi:hypothetical protein
MAVRAEVAPVRAAMTDAELGIIRWNRLREIERAYWLARADSAVPADAWAAFQRETARERGQEVSRQKRP